MSKEKYIKIFKTLIFFLAIYIFMTLISSIMMIGIRNTFYLKFLNTKLGIITSIENFIISVAGTIIVKLLIKNSQDNKKIDKIFWVILALSLFIIFYTFIIGKGYYMYSDVGADTIQQYFPYFLNELLNLKDGTFATWNFHYGLGESIFSVNAWTFDIFSILLVLVCLLVGVDKLQYLLVWMQIVKIIVVFILSKKYLSYFLKDRLSLCLAAYLGTMNGFLFLWGQHYFFGTAYVYILLMLCGIENFLAKESKGSIAILAISIASLLIFSYYIAYMVLITSAVYFLFRYMVIHKKLKIKQTAKSFGKCLYCVITGFLLSGIVFIPSCYHILTSSSRLSGASSGLLSKMMTSFVESLNLDYIKLRLSRLVSNNLLCMNDRTNYPFTSYYELPQLFCTIFVIFFFIQWLIYELKKNKTKRDYFFLILKILIFYLLIFNGVSGLIFNIFAYKRYRYTYIIIPFLALMIGIVLEKVLLKNKINFTGLVISAILSILIWYSSYGKLTSENYRVSFIILIFLIMGFITLLVARKKKKHLEEGKIVFLLIVIVSTIFDNYITTNHREYIQKEKMQLAWSGSELLDDTGRAMSWIKENDQTFYRVERIGFSNFSTFGDPFIYQISSATWYNTTASEELCKFYKIIYPNSNLKKYYKVAQLNNQNDLQALSLLNSKYILTVNEINMEGLKKINQFGNILVYKNTYTDSIAKWYTKTISEDDFMSLNEKEKAKILYDKVISNEKFDLDKNAKAVIDEFNLQNHAEVVGKLKSNGNGLLMISIPTQEGWGVYIDNELVDIHKLNYALIGIEVPEGEHTIKLKYKAPKFELGILSSIIGTFSLVIIFFPYNKLKNNKKEQ